MCNAIIKIWRQSTDGKVDDFCRDATVQRRLDISGGDCLWQRYRTISRSDRTDVTRSLPGAIAHLLYW
ncbi:MAG: hypothetical protein GDA56_17070 [Hormoscilla sp. GM7CHS1pb]|nr:hypothetical protein [Hormoscilla sp. GM7CHS1pb]